MLYIYKHKDEDFNAMDICKELEISTTASVSNITYFLEKKGMIKLEKQGRKNKYHLTKDGEQVAERLKEILQIIKRK